MVSFPRVIITMTTIVFMVTMFTSGYYGHCSSGKALVSHPPQKFLCIVCSVNTNLQKVTACFESHTEGLFVCVCAHTHLPFIHFMRGRPERCPRSEGRKSDIIICYSRVYCAK